MNCALHDLFEITPKKMSLPVYQSALRVRHLQNAFIALVENSCVVVMVFSNDLRIDKKSEQTVRNIPSSAIKRLFFE